MKIIKSKNFSNGVVYGLETKDGFPIETTDTFLPFYTKDCINENTNRLKDYYLADRNERWMIGVSTMSGCPCKCIFCATGNLSRMRNLTDDEIVEQVEFILNKNPEYSKNPPKEFKINYTRMGEPFFNIENVKKAIIKINDLVNNFFNSKITVHHYISSIGIKDSDFSWIKDNITLQFSIHALSNERRNEIIPFKNKMTLEEIGKVRVNSNNKITLNLTLIEEKDFDLETIKNIFDREVFFIKLSPINMNSVSENAGLGNGIIHSENLI
jgi:23S rRNA (adenine2503-C2)-methyltransferase